MIENWNESDRFCLAKPGASLKFVTYARHDHMV